MNVEISHLFVSPGHDFKGRHGKGSLDHGVVSAEEIECVAGSGVRGDRYFDYKEDFKGQITFFSVEVYEAVKAQFELPELKPSAFRRNVVVRGVALNELVGKRFAIGGVVFEGSEEAHPCYWMDEACAEGVEEFLKGKGGLRARVLVGGVLGKGVGELVVGSEE
ncbi:MAG: MOSC domain-containing protein [Verrucomicrobia bacterium]|nr:MOSC domain-containing protein [Verrucomicrobiota bacterium]